MKDLIKQYKNFWGPIISFLLGGIVVLATALITNTLEGLKDVDIEKKVEIAKLNSRVIELEKRDAQKKEIDIRTQQDIKEIKTKVDDVWMFIYRRNGKIK